jgi:hypothetical protein
MASCGTSIGDFSFTATFAQLHGLADFQLLR